MSNAAAKHAKSALAPTKTPPGSEVAEPKLNPVEAKVPTYTYYRVHKISGFLSEILQVEVDESKAKPKRIGKEDDRGILLDRLRDILDVEAKANFTAEQQAKKKQQQAGK